MSQDLTETPNFVEIDRRELQELWNAFKKISEDYKVMQWYYEVNKAGFCMITSKFERVQSSSTCNSLLNTFKFDETHFSRQNILLLDVKSIDAVLSKFSKALSSNRADLTYFSLSLQAFFSSSHLEMSNAAYMALREDDLSSLDAMLDGYCTDAEVKDRSYDSLLFTLLQCSILYNARKCIKNLLSKIGSLRPWTTNIIKLQRLRTSLNIPCWLRCREHQKSYAQEFTYCADCDASCQGLTKFCLERLQPQDLNVLIEKDALGRLLLHDAAAYGLPKTCQMYLDYMQDQRYFSAFTTLDAILSRDSEGRTPLCLAVISDSYAVAKILLGSCVIKESSLRKTTHESKLQDTLDMLLPIAIKYDFTEIVKLLLAHGANVNMVGICGETALYVAAQFGHENYVRDILGSVPL